MANIGGAAVSTDPCWKPVRSTCKNQQISSAGMASERVRRKCGPAEGSALEGTEVTGEPRCEVLREWSDMARIVRDLWSPFLGNKANEAMRAKEE